MRNIKSLRIVVAIMATISAALLVMAIYMNNGTLYFVGFAFIIVAAAAFMGIERCNSLNEQAANEYYKQQAEEHYANCNEDPHADDMPEYNQ